MIAENHPMWWLFKQRKRLYLHYGFEMNFKRMPILNTNQACTTCKILKCDNLSCNESILLLVLCFMYSIKTLV